MSKTTKSSTSLSEQQSASGAEAARVATTARRLARWVLPPLLAFALAQAILLLAAHSVSGYAPGYLKPGLHAAWDSGQYVNIAKSGYALVHCDPHTTPFKATDWCGRAGWFPLYPALMHQAHAVTGWDLGMLGWGLSEAFALGTMVLVWWLLGATVTVANLACLALAAVFPGSVYDHAVFPISLCTFASLACLGLLVRSRWVAAGFVGAAAAAAYPIGALLSPVAGLWLLVAGRGRRLARLLRGAAAGGLVLLGLAAVGWVMQSSVGQWDAYVRVQRSYGNGIHNPVATFWGNLLTPRLWHVSPVPPVIGRLHLRDFPKVELVLVVVVVVLALVATLLRRPAVRADLAFAFFAVAAWIAPLVAGGRVSQYRQYALVLPAVVLLRDLPRVVQLALVAVAVACTYGMAVMFDVDMLI